MGISRYLAMTAAEMESFSVPENTFHAYMACHFSPYATGLSNIPKELPAGSMLIVNDRTPLHGHDAQRIAAQLLDAHAELSFDCLLLDLERPDILEYDGLCRMLVEALPCPVGISAAYGMGLECPVFLPPAPLDVPLEEYIAPWKGRKVWLDVAPEAACVTVTEKGSSMVQVPFTAPPENAFTDEALHCRYRVEVGEDSIQFHLWRDPDQTDALIDHAQRLGIAKCISLFQELYYNK